jgi:hypothetical protein
LTDCTSTSVYFAPLLQPRTSASTDFPAPLLQPRTSASKDLAPILQSPDTPTMPSLFAGSPATLTKPTIVDTHPPTDSNASAPDSTVITEPTVPPDDLWRESIDTFLPLDSVINCNYSYKASNPPHVLSAAELIEGQKPYTKNTPSLKNDLKTLVVFVLQVNGVPQAMTLKLNDNSIPMAWWSTAMAILFDTYEIEIRTMEELTRLQIIVFRLAHTHPKNLCEGYVKKTKSIKDPSRLEKALWAASIYLGTLFRNPVKKTQPTMNDYFSKTAATPRTNNAATNSNTITPAAQTTNQTAQQDISRCPTPPARNGDSSTPVNSNNTSYAAVASKPPPPQKPAPSTDKLSKIRMKFKFEFPAKEDITDAHLRTLNCYEYFRHLLGTLLGKYKDEDPKICILPWKLGASNTPILVPSKVPKTKDLLEPYVSGLTTPAWATSIWFHCHLAFNPKGPGLVTFPHYKGTYSEWFKTHGHVATFLNVHDSDDEVNIGILRYSGDFVDLDRLLSKFHDSYRGKKIIDKNLLGIYRVGFKIDHSDLLGKEKWEKGRRKKSKIGLPSLFADANLSACYSHYRNNHLRPIQVWCHTTHAFPCKEELIRQFNRNQHFLDRPGQYEFSFLANSKYQLTGHVHVGSSEEQAATAATIALLKSIHVQTAGSLIVLHSKVVHNIDTAVMIKNITLTYPLNRERKTLSPAKRWEQPKVDTSDRLFYSVDLDTRSGGIQFACLSGRLSMASSFIAALPDYLEQFYDLDALETWVPQENSMDTGRFEFLFDSEGRWTGQWKSSDDTQLEMDLLAHCLDDSDLDFIDTSAVPELSKNGNNDPNPFKRPILYGTPDPNPEAAPNANASLGPISTSSGRKRTNDEVSKADDESLNTQQTIVQPQNADKSSNPDVSMADEDASMSTVGTAVTAPGFIPRNSSTTTPFTRETASANMTDGDESVSTVGTAVTAPGAAQIRASTVATSATATSQDPMDCNNSTPPDPGHSTKSIEVDSDDETVLSEHTVPHLSRLSPVKEANTPLSTPRRMDTPVRIPAGPKITGLDSMEQSPASNSSQHNIESPPAKNREPYRELDPTKLFSSNSPDSPPQEESDRSIPSPPHGLEVIMKDPTDAADDDTIHTRESYGSVHSRTDSIRSQKEITRLSRKAAKKRKAINNKAKKKAQVELAKNTKNPSSTQSKAGSLDSWILAGKVTPKKVPDSPMVNGSPEVGTAPDGLGAQSGSA